LPQRTSVIPSEKVAFRLDFETVPLEPFTKNGKLYVRQRYILNRKRYERKTINGLEYEHDKFEDINIPVSAIDKIMQAQIGKSVYMVMPKTISYNNYIDSRRQGVSDFLDGRQPQYQHVDKSADFLAKLEREYEGRFAILCIDIVGSTNISQKIAPVINARWVGLFAREMSAIVGNFHGYVLKYTGDGLIAYFPIKEPVSMDDTTVDCAMAMKHFIENFLNEVLPSKQFPSLKFRIGIDTGEAIVEVIGDETIKQHQDLIGQTINIATKIQAQAKENAILIGNTTLRGLHTDKRLCFAREGEYELENKRAYPLHTMIKYPDKPSLVLSS
jgi:adenylate cyclase